MERSPTLRVFAWRRAVRIWPALIVVTLLTAFLMGPLVTSSDGYFAELQTYRYLSNIFFLFDPQLPGVFLDNPLPDAVNGSLWTLLHEVGCYICLAISARLGLFKARWSYLLVFALAVLGSLALEDTTGPLFKLQQFCTLASYFVGGAALYLYRDRIPLNLAIAAGALAAVCAGLAFGAAMVSTALFVPYLAIFIGFQKEWIKLPGDYSYGIYVWAFPVQQLLVHFGVGTSPLTNIALAAPLTIALGAASWTFVERPALKLKAIANSPLFRARLKSKPETAV